MSLPELSIFDSVESLNDNVRASLLSLAEDCVRKQGTFRMSLSGGSTPKRLYQSLVGSSFPWANSRLFWGDERNVPHEHADSNFRMVKEAMLQPAHVPSSSYRPYQSIPIHQPKRPTRTNKPCVLNLHPRSFLHGT